MSKCKPISIATTLACWLLSGTSVLYGQQTTETSIENIFQMGLIAQDTNGDQISSSDQAAGQVEWLQKMHAAGLYLDSLTYPRLASLGSSSNCLPR